MITFDIDLMHHFYRPTAILIVIIRYNNWVTGITKLCLLSLIINLRKMASVFKKKEINEEVNFSNDCFIPKSLTI